MNGSIQVLASALKKPNYINLTFEPMPIIVKKESILKH